MAYDWKKGLGELLKKKNEYSVDKMAMPLNLIEHQIGPPKDKDKRESISADALREYLTTIYGIQGLVISVIKICNLKVEGNLSLNGTTTKAGLEFFNCGFLRDPKKEDVFDGYIWLSDSVLRSLMLTDCSCAAIIAPRLRLSGSFKMEDPSKGKKRSRISAINLDGAKIGGNLNLSGLELEGIDYVLQEERQESDQSKRQESDQSKRQEDFYSLRGDGIEVGGNIVLDDGFAAHKGVRLNGCTIGRTISFSGSKIYADYEPPKNANGKSSGNGKQDQRDNGDRENRYSLSMTVAHIKGNLNFGREKKPSNETAYETQFVGTIRLSKTTVEGGVNFRNLKCSASRKEFTEPKEKDDLEGKKYDPHEEEDYAVDARGLTVKAPTQFINIEAHGPLNFRRATLLGGIFGDGMRLYYPSAQVFIGDDATITGAVSLRSIKTNGILQFNQAHLLGGFTLSGFNLHKCDWPNGGIRGTLKHWRPSKTCGLVIERAKIKGQFDITGVDVLTFCDLISGAKIKAQFDITGPTITHLTDQNKNLKVISRLCLDGTEIPAIRQGAIKDLEVFEEVHLLDCTYSSVTWHEDARESTTAQATSGKPSNSSVPRNIDLSAWVRVLDRTYAKESYRITEEERNRKAESHSVSPILKWDSIKYKLVWDSIKYKLEWDWIKHKLASQKSLIPAVIFPQFLVWPICLLPAICLLPVWLLILLVAFALLFPIFLLRFPLLLWAKAVVRFPVRKMPQGMTQSNHESAQDKTCEPDTFHPQPYIQLARALRAAGFDREANSVIIDMEWRRTWHGHLGMGEKFWQYLKGLLLSFGLDKVRPVLILVILTLLSSLPFTYAFEQSKIIPSRANQYCPASPPDMASTSSKPEGYKIVQSDGSEFVYPLLNDLKSGSGLTKEPNAHDWNIEDFCLVDNKESDALAYVQFNGLLFSLDAILPLTDLGQRKNWIFEPVAKSEDKVTNNNANWRYDLNAWGHDYLRGFFFNRYVVLFYADAVFGSLVTSMFLAGLVGLIANRY